MGGVDAFVVVIATIFSIKVVIKVVLFCFVLFLFSSFKGYYRATANW